MKVLTLNANLAGVGTFQRCFYFSRELARAGHDVTMVTVSRREKWRATRYYKRAWLGRSERPEGEGPWVRMIEGPALGYRWLPGAGSGPLDILLRLGQTLAGGHDVVYGFEYQPNVSWPVYLSRWLRGYRFFSDWCDWHAGESNVFAGIRAAHRVDRFLEERIRFLAERVSVISATLAERALAIGIPPARVVQVRQGADTEYVLPVESGEARERLGLPLDRPLLTAVHDEDMPGLVRVLARVLRRRGDVMLVVIGNVGAAPRDLAHELGIAGSVRFEGWVADERYPLYLAAADLCLLPQRDTLGNRARFPGKLLDFLAAGRAVVTNDTGEVGELLRSRPVGVLAAPGEEGFAAAILELLSDPARRLELGRTARTVMVEEWDWRKRGAQIAGLLGG